MYIDDVEFCWITNNDDKIELETFRRLPMLMMMKLMMNMQFRSIKLAVGGQAKCNKLLFVRALIIF
jgi:hypothetical protein